MRAPLRPLALLLASLSACCNAAAPEPPSVRPEPPVTSAQAPAARALPGPLASADPAAEPPGLDEEPVDEAPPPPPCPPLDERWAAAQPGPAALARARSLTALRATLMRRDAASELDPDPDGFGDIRLTPRSRAALRRLKEQTADALEARLADAVALTRGAPLPTCGLESFFARALRPTGAESPGDDRDVLRVESLLGGRLLGVVFAAPLAGGPDTTLVVFERTASGAYRRAMVVARHDFASITEGQLGLEFAAVATPSGGYHVLTAHGSPWISSAWRGAHLSIWEPGPDPARPRRLLDEGHSARMGESVADVAADAGGLRASFLSWNHLGSPDDPTRPFVRHFSLVGGSYRRSAPFVERARDLPDEWVHSPWSEAQLFTAPSARDRLEQVHRELQSEPEMIELRASLRASREGEKVVWAVEHEEAARRYAFVTAREEGEWRVVDVRPPPTSPSLRSAGEGK